MVTLDSNVAVYALMDEAKSGQALSALRSADFVSVQVLNELASVARRKLRLQWAEVALLVDKTRDAVATVLPILDEHNADALRIAARYQLSFYDALMLAVALSGGARTFYSEDMQHDLMIDGTLRVVDPFRPGAFAA